MKQATRQQVYKACELLETKDTTWSCWALTRAVDPHATGIVLQRIYYANFYEKPHTGPWEFGPTTTEERIMLLLMYLEARGDV